MYALLELRCAAFLKGKKAEREKKTLQLPNIQLQCQGVEGLCQTDFKV